jgi:hypothetical protein
MRALALIGMVAGCSGAPPPPPPPPVHPTVDAGVVAPAVSAHDCDQIIAHAIALEAAVRGSAATDEAQGSARVAIHRDCAKLDAAAVSCALAAKTVVDFEACDPPQ